MTRMISTLATAVVITLHAAAPALAQTPGRAGGGLAIPVVSADPDAAFTGTFTLTRFVPTANGVAAVGTLTGVLTPTGGTPTSIFTNVVVPTAIGDTACRILHLDLGPLFLDLLGLQVDLSEVVLDITAQPGPGNLLGNLLCAVTGLLDSPGGLARLLNQILGILG
jgi:hypothetical protein